MEPIHNDGHIHNHHHDHEHNRDHHNENRDFDKFLAYGPPILLGLGGVVDDDLDGHYDLNCVLVWSPNATDWAGSAILWIPLVFLLDAASSFPLGRF